LKKGRRTAHIRCFQLTLDETNSSATRQLSVAQKSKIPEVDEQMNEPPERMY